MDVRIFRSFFPSLVALGLVVSVSSLAQAQFGGPGGTGGGSGGTADQFCFSNFGGPSCENVIIEGEECCNCVGGDEVEMHTCPTGPEPPVKPKTPSPPPPPCNGGGSGGGGGSCPQNGAEQAGMVGGTASACQFPAVRDVFSAEVSNDMVAMRSSGGAGSGGSGCAGCSSGGSGGSGSSMESIAITRRRVPANQIEAFSFGRGMASDYDMRLTLYPLANDDPVALLYDPKLETTFYLEDTGANGTYDLEDNIYYQSIQLVDSSGNAVTDPGDAATSDVFAKVTRRNGWVYNLKVAATPLEGGEFVSQLTSIVDPQGSSVDLTYKTFTQAQIDSSPSRQLQIDTITDGYGNTASVSYNSTQQGGQWVISQVDLNSGEAVANYTYNSNGLLNTVSRGTEVVGTYTYGIDSQYGFATIQSNRRDVYGHGRNDTIMLSTDYQNGDGTVVNQYANILHGARNGLGQVKYMLYSDSNNVGWFKILYEQQMIEYKHGESVRWYETYTQTGGGYDDITGTLEPSYMHHPNVTESQILNMQPPTTVDETGYTTTNTYDSNGNLTRVDHPDGTYEKYLYDSNNLPTYYRDRAGFVQLTERDSNERVIRIARGMIDVSGSGTATATTEAVQDIRGYYGSGHANEGMLAWAATTAYTSSVSAPPANERTDYEYDANQRLAKMKGPLPNGQAQRPETIYVWTGNYKTSETDPLGHTTTFSYDFMGRQIGTAYSDGTTEQTLYDDVNLAIYRKNRVGVVSKSSYGISGRMGSSVAAYGRDADLTDGLIDSTNPAEDTSVTTYGYAVGISRPYLTTNNGSSTTAGLDYRGRQIGLITNPSSRSTHTTITTYVNNQKFSVLKRITDNVATQDYDITSYYGYSANGLTVRTIQTRKPGVSFADNTAVLNATRVSGEDPDYIINDAVRDIRGQIVQLIDPTDIETLTTYDALGRSLTTTRTGGSLSLASQQSYDADGNVTQQISEAGVVTDMTYDQAGNLKTRTEAPGTAIAATWTYTYTLEGKPETMTAPLGGVTTSVYETCCGFTRGSKNALGHGSVTNADSAGRSVHTATLEDFDSHSNLLNPTDAKTLAENTSKYDDLGRVIYRTKWKSPRGVINRNDPPIAGLGGVALADGVTTQNLYDNIIGDGVGLDSSAGVSINLLSGGTGSVSIAAAVTKLADTTANGGAGMTWPAGARGTATVSLSADEKTMRVSISDAAGRSVFSGQMWGPASSTPNTLINWNCTIADQYDAATASIVALKTSSVDLDGNQTHSLANGYGQSIASVDQLGNVSKQRYDASGRTLKSINALNHETVMTYDDLGRQLTVTDPLSNTRSTAYSATTGRVSSQTDAKGSSSSNTFDDRGRVTAMLDRLGKTTSKTYDLEGRQLTITDAENKQTTYVYNLLGQRTSTTLPDNSARAMSYDPAGRLTRTDLPTGKSRTNVYEFSGVMDKVDYRSAGNALTGTDDFTYDALLRRTASSSRDGVSQAMTYDDRGQMSSESTTYGGQTYTVSYTRNDRGQTTKVTYPSGRVVDYDYTDRGLLDTIDVDSSQIEDRGYNDLGQLNSVDRPSVDETRTWFNNGQVNTIANTNVGTATYAYDDNGNKLSESWSGAMSSWNFTTQSGGNDGYDAEDRFLNFNQSGQSKTLAMTRSNIGNISNVNLNGTGTARSYSDAHELTSVGGSSQSFDTDGNLTAATNGNTFTWDEAGMMQQANVSGGPTVEYGYGAAGKRTWKKVTDGSVTETVYVCAGPNCIAEYVKGAAPASSGNEYVYAQGIDSLVMLLRSGGSQKLAVTRNQQWSVSALVNASGAVVERYTYDHFGKRTILAANGSTVRNSSSYDMPYGYTSRRHDTESGLMYFRARYYDPNSGEFISRDPLEYVDGTSLYRGYFVIRGTDPEGKQLTELPPWSFCQTVGQRPTGKNCGEASAEITWSMIGADVVEAGLNGWVIQKVEFDYDYTDCDGEDIGPEDACYFEAWQVRDGVVYKGDNVKEHEADWFSLGNRGEGTKGRITVSGSVTFIKDYELDSEVWGSPGAPGHPPQTPNLPWLKCEDGKPWGWEDSNKTNRKLVSEWRCCPCEKRKETDVSGSSGWVDL